MRRFITGVFALIGFIVVAAVVAVTLIVGRFTAPIATLPDTIVLRVDLDTALTDGPAADAVTRLLVGTKPSLREVLDGIERAGDDRRVKGLYVRLGNDVYGLAEVQQLRDAIAAFRAKGKFAIAFADTFGEFGPGTRPYYLATACDQIWLQPMGLVGLTGLYSEVPFVKGTLDLLGVTASFDHREEFKTAMNSLTETRMTAPHREEVTALLNSMAGQIVHGIAAGRHLSDDAVRGLIDRGPFFADDARQAGLVDRLDYADAALRAARQRAGAGAEAVTLKKYLAVAGRPHRRGAEIALIYGSGLIQRGSGLGGGLLGGDSTMNAAKVARAFRAAARDKSVRAILFRIDSPGGSVVASETIWHAVVAAQQHGKPVIVSMGNLAGSGGYYIAAPAVKIVAEPATLTGSIGVLAGKVVLAGLLQKIGVTIDTAQIGANAAMFSGTGDFSALAHQRLETFLDQTYRGFKERVAKGRQMTADQVEAVAKGRVWTGEEAKARGLVDALGGYKEALALARAAAKLAPGAPVRLVVFPHREDAAELLYDRLTGRDPAREADSARTLEHALGLVQPLVQRLDALLEGAPVLTMRVLTMPVLGAAR